MIERIDDPQDSRVAAYRGVRDADLMRTAGVFVAEGRLVVRRVIDDGRFEIVSVLLNDAALGDLSTAIARLDPGVPVFVCPHTALADLTGFNLHRGCLALVRRPPPVSIAALSAATRTLIVLDGVANADNVGGIFRNAAAFGAGGVLLDPASCDPLYRKAIRVSMGAALQVPFARCERQEWPAALQRLRAGGFTVAALTPRRGSEPLDAVAPRIAGARLALVVGAEGAGVSAAVEECADHRVRIPIDAGVDSLNVAVAAGIALYRLAAGRR